VEHPCTRERGARFGSYTVTVRPLAGTRKRGGRNNRAAEAAAAAVEAYKAEQTTAAENKAQ